MTMNASASASQCPPHPPRRGKRMATGCVKFLSLHPTPKSYTYQDFSDERRRWASWSGCSLHRPSLSRQRLPCACLGTWTASQPTSGNEARIRASSSAGRSWGLPFLQSSSLIGLPSSFSATLGSVDSIVWEPIASCYAIHTYCIVV